MTKEKQQRYRASRAGEASLVTLEAQGRRALTGDYLRVNVESAGAGAQACERLHSGVLRGRGDDLYVEIDATGVLRKSWAASGMESPPHSHVSSA